MGLSLAGTLADILLTELFDHSIPKPKYTPAFVKKFVDDVITTAPKTQIDATNELLNQFNGRLKFTNETERERKISFLDMTLIHQLNGKIITNWYTKTTSSDRLLNYLSFHPYNMKYNIAKSFVNKVFTLSDPIFNGMNTKKTQQILLKNNYPQKMIDMIFKDRRFIQQSQKPSLVENRNSLACNTFRSYQKTSHERSEHVFLC